MTKKIPALELVRDFQRMHREDWDYDWGASSDGNVDCSGAFVWAYRQRGLSIYHGSNRIARVHVERLIPYAEAAANGLIVPGMAAFKLHLPGESGYDLSSQYKPGGDRYTGDVGDYYHIGLVDEDTRYVLNAQGTKNDFERNKITDNWSHVAKLLDVDYETPGEADAPMIDVHDTIRRGANGSAVVRAQGLLVQHGYDIATDGVFGKATEAAVKAFQRETGLKDDGIVGPLTWAALAEGIPDVEMEPDAPPGNAWDSMTLEEKVEDLHRWRLSMMGGGDTDGS